VPEVVLVVSSELLTVLVVVTAALFSLSVEVGFVLL